MLIYQRVKTEEYEIPELFQVKKKEDHIEISGNISKSVLDRLKRITNVPAWHDHFVVEYKCLDV